MAVLSKRAIIGTDDWGRLLRAAVYCVVETAVLDDSSVLAVLFCSRWHVCPSVTQNNSSVLIPMALVCDARQLETNGTSFVSLSGLSSLA